MSRYPDHKKNKNKKPNHDPPSTVLYNVFTALFHPLHCTVHASYKGKPLSNLPREDLSSKIEQHSGILMQI